MNGKIPTRFIATFLAAAFLAGCSTVNPYTRETQTSKAAKGAAIGAATGAVIGVLTGDDSEERRERALIGAGAGAIAGGSIGFYMDQQEAKLRQQLEGTGVSVTRNGDNIILNMPGNITFQTDNSDLRPNFFPVLNSVALVLEEFDKTTVEVAGHTDSTGADDYNQTLSEKRASTVSQYLASQGVDGSRFWTVGFGEKHPVASNDTTEGRQQNRRVEIQLVPIGA